MKKIIVNNVVLIIIVSLAVATTIFFVGIRHGSGNRSLLTMRSGLIKIRRGLQEFSRGLSQFVLKGLATYRTQFEVERVRTRRELYERREQVEQERSEHEAINEQIREEADLLQPENEEQA